MATATRLESLLASPNKGTASKSNAQRRSDGGDSSHHCTTDQLTLHVRHSNGATAAAQGAADGSAGCRQLFGGAYTSCQLQPWDSQPLSAMDTHPAARRDNAAPASGAAHDSATEHPPPGECSSPGGAVSDPVNGTALVRTATPQPRGPDARAVPTARHRPPAAQQLFGCSNNGTGANSCCRTAHAGAAAPDERECLQLLITAATRRARVAEAAAAEACWQAEAAAAELRDARQAQRSMAAKLQEMQSSMQRNRAAAAAAASDADSAVQAARAEAAAAVAELQRTQLQLQDCQQRGQQLQVREAEAQQAAGIAVEAAAVARQHDAAAAVAASHAHKQLGIALERAALDAATILGLQEAAAVAVTDRAAALADAARACAAANDLRSDNAELRRRASAAEGLAAAVRRSAAFDAAEAPLARCQDTDLQAYVRLLEQEVAEAAEALAQLQQRLADAAAEVAADVDPMRARAAAAEVHRGETLHQLQLERHRVAALERLRLEDAKELSRLHADCCAARSAGARLATVLEAMLLAARRRRQQHHRQCCDVPCAAAAQLHTQPAGQESDGGTAAGTGLALLQLRETLDV